MKFIVTRTSDETPPCEEAKKEKIVLVECRRFESPEDFDKHIANSKTEKEPWCSVGTNHRKTDKGFICRDIGEKIAYVVEINSLEELISFCKKYGEVIVNYEFNEGDNYPSIEIYDDWRE